METSAAKTSQPESPTHEREVPARGWRNSKELALGELLMAAALFVADACHRLPLGRGPWLIALAWVSLSVRKVGWRGIGFAKYKSWRRTVAVGLVCGVALESFELFVSQPLLVRVFGRKADLSQFHDLAGNLKLTLLYLLLAWVVAAFGEELIYRGYLMNRVADLLNRTRIAWIVSLIAVQIVFGLVHKYQGWTGVVDEGLMGVLLAIIYLRSGRNLFVPIIAHGIQDSIDLILIFLRKYPGM
jgi:CAAX protease family protein